jgi:hypothetical protein
MTLGSHMYVDMCVTGNELEPRVKKLGARGVLLDLHQSKVLSHQICILALGPPKSAGPSNKLSTRCIMGTRMECMDPSCRHRRSQNLLRPVARACIQQVELARRPAQLPQPEGGRGAMYALLLHTQKSEAKLKTLHMTTGALVPKPKQQGASLFGAKHGTFVVVVDLTELVAKRRCYRTNHPPPAARSRPPPSPPVWSHWVAPQHSSTRAASQLIILTHLYIT